MSSLQHAEQRAQPQAGRHPDDFAAKLDHLGVLRFSGQDAESFLQGQLSCDVSLPSSYGAYCTPQGRMLASFLLWRAQDGFAMMLSRDLADSTRKQISKFVLRSRVTIEDASEALLLVGAAGAQAERALAAAPASSVRLK